MADNSTWTRWYREGTVDVTQESKAVTGHDTYWLSASLKPGDIFSLDGVTDYEVNEVIDDTHLTLMTEYTGKTATSRTYSIVRSFSATTSASVAAQTAGLVSTMAQYVDKDMKTVQGKSAYQIAQDEGFVGTQAAWVSSLKGDSAYTVAKNGGYKGTEAEWLESLKAAGEWSKMDYRTAAMATSLESATYSGQMRNHLVRGKDLGTEITDEQWQAIYSGKFTDMYLGDYWNITLPVQQINGATKNVRFYVTIIDFNYFRGNNNYSRIEGTRVSSLPHLMYFANYGINGSNKFQQSMHSTAGYVPYTQTDVHEITLRAMQATLEELWGAEHMYTIPNNTVPIDTDGNTVVDDLKITLPPLCLVAPLRNTDQVYKGCFHKPVAYQEAFDNSVCTCRDVTPQGTMFYKSAGKVNQTSLHTSWLSSHFIGVLFNND